MSHLMPIEQKQMGIGLGDDSVSYYFMVGVGGGGRCHNRDRGLISSSIRQLNVITLGARVLLRPAVMNLGCSLVT